MPDRLSIQPVDRFSRLISRLYRRLCALRKMYHLFYSAQIISLHVQIGKALLIGQARVILDAAVNEKPGSASWLASLYRALTL